MPTWQDLQRQQARRAATTGQPKAEAQTARSASATLPPAAAGSPRLQQLLAERQQLERRMHSLAGRSDDVVRYPVASAADRRAEMQQWVSQREQATGEQGLRAPRLGRQPARAPGSRAGRDAANREPGTPVATSAWNTLRDARRAASQGIDSLEAALASTDALDERRLSGDLERALNRPDLSDADRTAARRGLSEGMGEARAALDGPRRQVQAGLNRAREALAAGERIERNWQSRRDAIGGWDLERVAQSYEQRRQRLLEVATGSVAQLAERMDGLRQVLQQRRADSKAQEREDDARRERALERRQQRREEEGSPL